MPRRKPNKRVRTKQERWRDAHKTPPGGQKQPTISVAKQKKLKKQQKTKMKMKEARA